MDNVTLSKKFWKYVDGVPDENGCLIWKGGKSLGYGIVSMYPDKPKRAHVVAFYLREGRWPDRGMHICHSCGNRLCVMHIYEGTPAQNNADTGRMGRWNNSRDHVEKCPSGHTYDMADREGYRSCSICRGIQSRKAQVQLRSQKGKVPKSESCSSCWYSVLRCRCVQFGLVPRAGDL